MFCMYELTFNLKGIILSKVQYGEFSYPLDKLILMKSKGIKTKVPTDKLVVNKDTVLNNENCVLVTPNADNFIVLTMPAAFTSGDETAVIIFSKVLLKSVRTVTTSVVEEKQFVNAPRFVDNRNRNFSNSYNSGYQNNSQNGYRDR